MFNLHVVNSINNEEHRTGLSSCEHNNNNNTNIKPKSPKADNCSKYISTNYHEKYKNISINIPGKHTTSKFGKYNNNNYNENYNNIKSQYIWAFSIGNIINDIAQSLWFNYLLFYMLTIAKLSNSQAGLVILIGQLTDVTTTPIAGKLADKYTKIKIYIPGMIIEIIAMLMLYNPFYLLVDSSYQFYYFILSGILLNIGSPCVMISNFSMISTLTNNNSVRDTLVEKRTAFTSTAQVLTLVMSFLVFYYVENKYMQYALLANICLLISICCISIFLFYTLDLLNQINDKRFDDYLNSGNEENYFMNSGSQSNSMVSSSSNNSSVDEDENNNNNNIFFDKKLIKSKKSNDSLDNENIYKFKKVKNAFIDIIENNPELNNRKVPFMSNNTNNNYNSPTSKPLQVKHLKFAKNTNTNQTKDSPGKIKIPNFDVTLTFGNISGPNSKVSTVLSINKSETSNSKSSLMNVADGSSSNNNSKNFIINNVTLKNIQEEKDEGIGGIEGLRFDTFNFDRKDTNNTNYNITSNKEVLEFNIDSNNNKIKEVLLESRVSRGAVEYLDESLEKDKTILRNSTKGQNIINIDNLDINTKIQLSSSFKNEIKLLENKNTNNYINNQNNIQALEDLHNHNLQIDLEEQQSNFPYHIFSSINFYKHFLIYLSAQIGNTLTYSMIPFFLINCLGVKTTSTGGIPLEIPIVFISISIGGIINLFLIQPNLKSIVRLDMLMASLMCIVLGLGPFVLITLEFQYWMVLLFFIYGVGISIAVSTGFAMINDLIGAEHSNNSGLIYSIFTLGDKILSGFSIVFLISFLKDDAELLFWFEILFAFCMILFSTAFYAYHSEDED